jgi:hypothetical protein
MTVLSGIALYCFFALKYPYHLHFQEQYQLFESTWDYFRTVAAVPGGFADWLGRFLTQFCYYAPAGAAVLAVLLCGVQLTTWAVCRRRTLTAYALSFLPAATLAAFYCDESALMGGAVALALSLGAAALCIRISGNRLRTLVEAVLIPVLYLACGPIAVVFVLIALIDAFVREGLRAWPAAVLFVALAVLCPLVANHLVAYPLARLATGVHYYRLHNFLPGMLWISAVCAVLVVAFSFLPMKERPAKRQLFTGMGLFLGVAALGTVLVVRSADWDKEEWMRYDFMVRMEMWNRIMMAADRKNPDNPTTVSCLNLALAKTGRMADHQFDYFQNGPDGLLPEFIRAFTGPVSTGEIYWHLGMVNTAQRFAFEAQEAIPDFQKSARCYKRLVETNIVNGDLDVARKYLSTLENATFYRRWARETRALLDAGTIFENRPELARAKALRLKEHDFLFSDTEMDSMLGLLFVENAGNDLALRYLLSWCLLKKDLDRFAEVISLLQAPEMPKSYQEALLLRWVLTHSDFVGLPPYLSPENARRISQFISDARTDAPEETMRQKYGDTYWFYYYYRYRTQP